MFRRHVKDCLRPWGPRHHRFHSTLSQSDVQYFRQLVNDKDVVTDADDLAKYNMDWTRRFRGHSRLALRPANVEQVSAILKYCNEKGLAIVPQGGNTGLVGGATPVADEIVLSLERMNRIISHNAQSGVINVEGGCILEQAESFLRDRGFMMPLDLGAKGSCTVGGNLATNAGGIRLMRYGSLHGNTLGLQVVLADGSILDDRKEVRKDNTGYDMKQLFIGSEGTLGVITASTILTPVLPTSVNVALITVPSFKSIEPVFSAARRALGEILAAFEFWDGKANRLLIDHYGKRLIPAHDEHEFTVLIETNGSNSSHDQEKLMGLLEHLTAGNIIKEGILAQDEMQARELWAWREEIPGICAHAAKHVYKYDLSLPTALMYHPITMLSERLGGEAPNSIKHILGFGHYGDGNIHVNIGSNVELDAAQFEPALYQYVKDRGGSISAEHGIGQAKTGYLDYSKSPSQIRLMRSLKALLDPKNILSPSKVVQVDKK